MQLKTNIAEFTSEHEAILQVLEDEDIPAVEAGLSTIPGKPIPFSLSHPKDGFKNKLPESVFNQEIKNAGVMGDAWIDYTGRPKLKANFNVSDPEVETLIKEGKVFISDAFWHDPSTPYISSFEFDHLLIYPRASNIPQGEPAAIILNQGEVPLMTEKQETVPTSLEYANSLLKTNQAELVEKEKVILTLNQQIEEKDKEIAQKNELVTNQTKEIESLKGQLIDIEKAEELKVNQDLFKAYPEGIQKKFEERLGELDDSKKAKRLLLEMNQAWASIPAPEFSKPEGTQFTTNQTNENEYEKINAEFKAATGVV